MKITAEITPEHDSFNSYPSPVEFILSEDQIKVVLLSTHRELIFKTDDLLNMLEVFRMRHYHA